MILKITVRSHEKSLDPSYLEDTISYSVTSLLSVYHIILAQIFDTYCAPQRTHSHKIHKSRLSH